MANKTFYEPVMAVLQQALWVVILRWVNLYSGHGDFQKKRDRDIFIFTSVSGKQWPKKLKMEKLRLLTQVLHEHVVWKGLMAQQLRSQKAPPISSAMTVWCDLYGDLLWQGDLCPANVNTWKKRRLYMAVLENYTPQWLWTTVNAFHMLLATGPNTRHTRLKR